MSEPITNIPALPYLVVHVREDEGFQTSRTYISPRDVLFFKVADDRPGTQLITRLQGVGGPLVLSVSEKLGEIRTQLERLGHVFAEPREDVAEVVES